MQLFLTDGHCRENLFPFTEIRHTAAIRIGILTVKEKWEQLTGYNISLVQDAPANMDQGLYIPANLIPTQSNFTEIVRAAKEGRSIDINEEIKILKYPWQISQLNDWAIRKDFELMKAYAASESISSSNAVINASNIFIGEGVKMEFCILNANDGPIYIGSHAQLMEGVMIRGPVAICNDAIVKMGAKIYSGTTIGPSCIAGGEIKNSVMFANSNKAHDGYLGDSVIGEWCNIGAGTSNSNLKNNAGDVLFNLTEGVVNAGNKAGLMMGDYSRAAINTSFNTGTVVGISCNIFGNKIPNRFIPNFSWGDERYDLDKAIRDIDNWKRLKNKCVDEADKLKLTEIYNK